MSHPSTPTLPPPRPSSSSAYRTPPTSRALHTSRRESDSPHPSARPAGTSTSSSPQVPAGTHLARCCTIVDLGTQTETFQGATKQLRKVILIFELPSVSSVPSVVNKPRTLSREFTLSLSPKANLRKFLEAWRSRPFTEQEAAKFKLATILGTPCLLMVAHKSYSSSSSSSSHSADRKSFAAITAAARLPHGMIGLPSHYPLQHIDLDSETFDPTALGRIPNWIAEKLRRSPEYAQIRRHLDTQSDESSKKN